MSKTLIVYYSRKGENYVNGNIRNLSKGNTEVIAEMIADLTGGDLFEVETVKTYPADYYACIDEAKAELRQGARPELKAYPDSLDGYDTIFVGYPNWWGTMPMASQDHASNRHHDGVGEVLDHAENAAVPPLRGLTHLGSDVRDLLVHAVEHPR